MSRQHLVIAACVALGGALGSVCRWAASVLVPPRAGFPVSTLLVNVVGSFVIGVVLRWGAAGGQGTELRAFLAAGLCGGFTTFSAFSAETAQLLEQGAAGRAATYVALSVGASLAATFLGFAAARAVAGTTV